MTQLYDEYEQGELFIEIAEGYVPECEVLEELTDIMAPYNYLVKEQAIPKESTFTVDEFRQELLYNLFNEYWGQWNDHVSDHVVWCKGDAWDIQR